MIVRPGDGSQLLITQPDHAALAARIMREWRLDGLPQSPRRDDILLAVAEHDNGWHEVDAAPVVDAASGGILDFVALPYELRTGVWPRAVRRLEAWPYAAALVAQHALHVYRRYLEDPQWIPFFDTMQAMRDEALERAAGASLAQFIDDYRFVRIGDLASLTFCNGWSETQDEYGCSFTLDGTRLLVSPDPFGGELVPLEVPARRLTERTFTTPEAAAAAFARAEVVTVSGTAAAR